MSMSKKVLTMAFAAIFIVGAFIVAADSDSDATSAGMMNIYVYDGSSWTDYTNLSGYNALQALQSSGATFTGDTIDGYPSTDYIIQKSNTWGSYDEINENYGDLLTLNGVTETSTMKWNTYYYDGSVWKVGPAAIGFIVPFTDGALASANVVLYYGAVVTSVPAEVSTHVSSPLPMTDPSGDDYMMEFYLKVDASGYTPTIAEGTTVVYKVNGAWLEKDLEVSDLTSGITVCGYGSNAYAALINAIGEDNIDASSSYGPYNGWITTLFGLGTVSGDNYTYWNQTFNNEQYTSFVLGAYSTLQNVPTDLIGGSSTSYVMVGSSFSLTYMTYVYS